MRIAQVSPLYESVPPRLYGGTERVVSWLTEALVAMGHDVTLFASGDSQTSARLVPMCESALRLSKSNADPVASHLLLPERVLAMAEDFDVIHWHIDYMHFPASHREKALHVTTLHGRLDTPELEPLYRCYPALPLVSISDFQRRPLPFANWVGTVYHGLPLSTYQIHPQRGSYLAFLGRMSPEKRPDRAIEIARRVGMPLKMAAKVDKSDQEYFNSVVRPRLNEPGIEFVGEICEADKNEFLGGAMALLFPIDWPEPFGLVMLEAMACGTPVVAWPCGSVPEIVADGVNGRIVASVDEAVAAIESFSTLSRPGCRADFEQRFSAVRMAEDYVRLWDTMLHGKHSPVARNGHVQKAYANANGTLAQAAVPAGVDGPC
jgi:glycosyltransferase involved in cell wall biosynthesis